jgi:hypothetical protein
VSQAAELTVASPRQARRSAPAQVEPRQSDREAQTASPPANGMLPRRIDNEDFHPAGSAVGEGAKSNRPTGLQLQVDVTHQIGIDWREAIFSRGSHAEPGEINDGDRVRALPPRLTEKLAMTLSSSITRKMKICSLLCQIGATAGKSTRWHEIGLPDVIQSIDRS